MPAGKLNRKEIKRYTKLELRKICNDNGIHCNTKTSKADLVSSVFKNKQLRGSLPVKAKRTMSEKQQANLKKFRFKKKPITKEEDDSGVVRKPVEVAAPSKPNPKSNVKIDPTSSNKNEPAPSTLKQNISKSTNQGKATAKATITQKAQPKASVKPVLSGKTGVVGQFGETKEAKVEDRLNKQDKRMRDKASFQANKLTAQLGGTQFDAKRMRAVDSHTQRLRDRLNTNTQMIKVRNKELSDSIARTTDAFDRQLMNRTQKKSSRRVRQAVKRAKGTDEKKFDGQLDEFGNPIDLPVGASNHAKLERLLLLQAELSAGTITQEQFNKAVSELQRTEEVRSGQPIQTVRAGQQVAPQQPAQPEEEKRDERQEQLDRLAEEFKRKKELERGIRAFRESIEQKEEPPRRLQKPSIDNAKRVLSDDLEKLMTFINQQRKNQVKVEFLLAEGRELGLDLQGLNSKREMMRVLEREEPGFLDSISRMTEKERDEKKKEQQSSSSFFGLF